MKLHRFHVCRAAVTSFCTLLSALSLPLFLLCVSVSVSPGLLLGCMLGWKAIFFPASVPSLAWGLFLPLWTVLSCAVPALCASAMLSVRHGFCVRQTAFAVPVCTMQLLLACLWALCLLYRMPMPLCVLSCVICAVSALLLVRLLWKWYPMLGILMLIGGIWNVFLVFLCADF